nr:MAG TPA: hypothetical protein [Caudoviricetes sp.]
MRVLRIRHEWNVGHCAEVQCPVCERCECLTNE